MNRQKGARLCVLGFIVFAVFGFAADFSKLRPQGYLSDFAQVVDETSRQHMDRFCARVEAQTGAQIAVVTLDTLQGKAIEEVALTLFRTWGVGRKKANDGVLFLLSIQDRRSRITVGYGLEPVFPTTVATEILQGLRTELQARRYGEALLRGAREIGTRIARAKNITLASADDSLPGPLPSPSLGFASLARSSQWNTLIVLSVIAVAALAIWASRGWRRTKTRGQ